MPKCKLEQTALIIEETQTEAFKERKVLATAFCTCENPKYWTLQKHFLEKHPNGTTHMTSHYHCTNVRIPVEYKSPHDPSPSLKGMDTVPINNQEKLGTHFGIQPFSKNIFEFIRNFQPFFPQEAATFQELLSWHHQFLGEFSNNGDIEMLQGCNRVLKNRPTDHLKI